MLFCPQWILSDFKKKIYRIISQVVNRICEKEDGLNAYCFVAWHYEKLRYVSDWIYSYNNSICALKKRNIRMQIDGVKSLKEPHLYNGIAITFELETFPQYEHENFPSGIRKHIYKEWYIKYVCIKYCANAFLFSLIFMA